ncbi:transcription factor-like 5 protein isoform X3 [Clinocottus analis]|uniref:transcription factor-like 5 protein isoform X3 n=1 Tax=Clinocottus analis TaxID=304258 RepID=UPI0035C12422
MTSSPEGKMASVPSACTTLHVSPSSREHTCDPGGGVLSQAGCVTIDHGQMLGPDLGLMEMSEVEYTHLQHLIQAHMEAQAAPPDVPAARSHPASPVMPTQAIDLSTSTDEHYLVMPGEKTPASHGEVPGFVLARVREEDSPTELRANSGTSSQMRSRSAARVCLEKRFNSLVADTPRQQDIQPAVLSNFLTMLQQSAEAQEAAIHPQMHKWMKTDRANPLEILSPYGGAVFNPVTNMCEQVIGHNPQMVEPYKHPGLIIPKGFSFNFCPERFVTKAHYTSGSSSTEEQQLVKIGKAAFRKRGSTHGSQHSKAASAGPDSAGESGSSSASKRSRSHMSLIQRRERHNSKERERRKRIRLYCDELNMLVPFCESDTDKVTTLQWTTAFLGYMQKTYGDTFKEEFQRAFAEGKGCFLKSSPSSGPDPIHREMDEMLSIPLAVEQ